MENQITSALKYISDFRDTKIPEERLAQLVPWYEQQLQMVKTIDAIELNELPPANAYNPLWEGGNHE